MAFLCLTFILIVLDLAHRAANDYASPAFVEKVFAISLSDGNGAGQAHLADLSASALLKYVTGRKESRR